MRRLILAVAAPAVLALGASGSALVTAPAAAVSHAPAAHSQVVKADGPDMLYHA